MSILIKGMEIPPSCSRCPMLEGDRMDGLCHAASRWLDDDEFWTWYVYPEGDMDDSKPCNCPLVPVPEHGDLIDRDALMKILSKVIDINASIEQRNEATDQERRCLWWFEQQIGIAPTIIPADKEGKEGEG